MAKDGGGGETTVTNTNLPAYAEPYFKDIMSKTKALTGSPYQPYEGERLAGFSPDTLQAYGGLRDLASQGTFGVNRGMNMATQAVRGYDPTKYRTGYNATEFNPDEVNAQGRLGYGGYKNLLNRFMNPYTENVIDAQKQAAQLDYDRMKTDRNAAAINAGAFGGSRQAVGDYLSEEGLANRMAGITATGMNENFKQATQSALAAQQYNLDNRMKAALANQQFGLEGQRLGDLSRQFGADIGLKAQQFGDLSRQFGADLGIRGAGLMGDLDKLRVGLGTDLSKGLAAVGQDYQTQAQNALDLQYADFLNARDYPRQNLKFYSEILRGVPVSTNQESTTYQSQSPVSALVGSGLTGLALSKYLGGQKT